MKKTVVLLALAAIAWEGWQLSRPAHDEIATADNAPAAVEQRHDSGIAAVSEPAATAAAANRGRSTPAPALVKAAESPALTQFRSGRDFASLYRTLKSTSPTAETLYLEAEIYARCASRGNVPAQKAAEERANRRAKFVAGMAQGGIQASRRIEAFDALNVDPCGGLDLGSYSEAELARLLSRAADAGDPRARAWQLSERIENAYHAAQRNGEQRVGYDVTDADFAEARALLASGDPQVIQDLQGLLSSALEHSVVRLGDQPVDPGAMHAALTLLACDAGARCGADSRPLLMACAYRGQCVAGSVYEAISYDTSLAQSQLQDSYRRALYAMLVAHDFSGLTLTPSTGGPLYNTVFGGNRIRLGPG